MESIKALSFEKYEEIVDYVVSSQDEYLVFNLNDKTKVLFKEILESDFEFGDTDKFKGYSNFFITSSKIEGNQLILKRRNVKESVTEMNNLLENLLNDISYTKKDVTKELLELSKLSNISKEELPPILNTVFRSLFKDGYSYKGFKYYLTIEDDKYFFEKVLYCKYAVKFSNKDNIPWVDVYEIVNTNTKEIILDDCKYLELMQYAELEDFLEDNDISESRVFILDSEFKEFYYDGEGYFCEMTPSVRDYWWQNDTDLYREELNVTKTENSWGLNLICWSNKLIELGWECNYISEDITLKDYEALCEGRENHELAKDILRKIKVSKYSEEDKKSLVNQLTTIEESINDIITSNKRKLLVKTVNKVFSIEIDLLKKYTDRDLEEKLHTCMGLDCGFTHFKFKDTERNQKLISLYNEVTSIVDKYWLDIHLPIYVQSTTIQKAMAEYVVELVSKELNIDLYFWSVLD